MCQVKCEVQTGIYPGEKIARITTADGESVDVSVSPQQLSDDGLTVWKIHTVDERVLIELPCEALNGAWRIWVNEVDLFEPALGA